MVAYIDADPTAIDRVARSTKHDALDRVFLYEYEPHVSDRL